MQTSISKRAQNLILFLALIVLFSSVSLFAANTAFVVTNKIYHGVRVGDVNVGGLTAAEAEAKINSTFNEEIARPIITLEYKEQKWPIRAEDIDLRIDAKILADKAYEAGRTGHILSQLKERYLIINRGLSLPFDISYDQKSLKDIIAVIAQAIDHEPQNASLYADGSRIQIVPEIIGMKVEQEEVLAKILPYLNNRLASALKIAVSEVYPPIKQSDLNQINGLLASYTTQFDSSDVNRSQNIYIAARSIQGTLVKAGMPFSFNTQVGPRLAKNGYKEAPVFIEGKLVPDIGGGVCQVSSTLYNAVLLADMSIIERTPHFRPPGYVPLGQDATVADNLLDFKFSNPSSSNIYITSEVSGNQLTVLVYGALSKYRPEIKIINGETKELEPNTLVKQDPEIELGKKIIEVEGQKGFYVTTYRVKYNNSQEIQRELLSVDEFKPVDHIVKIGTKLPKPTK